MPDSQAQPIDEQAVRTANLPHAPTLSTQVPGSQPLKSVERGIFKHPLNGICPYYTMFPIEFPLAHLLGCEPGSWVLDPFCGRGTTLLAARMLGLNSLGIDANPVAVAISKAKLVQPKPGALMTLAQHILSKAEPDPRPAGEFWDWAFDPATLQQILRLRAGLRRQHGATANALRGIVLGALHGPVPKTKHSYFSNQMQRTFAPKPNYAVRYWRAREMQPPAVDVLSVISEKAERYFGAGVRDAQASVRFGDARAMRSTAGKIGKTVTSPPYFGMDSYVPDQWLRNWFVGGTPFPTYRHPDQISFGMAETFAAELAKVWRRVAQVSKLGAELVIRFGALASRPCNPSTLLLRSLAYEGSKWQLISVNPAGNASVGRRQTAQMGDKLKSSSTVNEIDVICRLGS